MNSLPITSLRSGSGRLGAALLAACLLETAGCALKSKLTGEDQPATTPPPTTPVLSLSPGSFDFGDTDKTRDSLSVWNSGIDSLDYSLTIDPGNGPANWLTTTPSTGSSTGEVDPIEIDIRRDLLAPGTFNAKVHVLTGGTTTDVPVTCEIVGVTPSVTSHSFGSSSGPFNLDVWNGGGGFLHYNVKSAPSWLKLDKWIGTSSGSSDKSRIHVTVDRTGLAGGHYTGTVEIDPDSNQGTHDAQIQFDMDVPFTGGILSVTPATDFQSSGDLGGPFSPASIDYTIQNIGDGDLDWTASATQSWLSLSLAGGTLSPNQQVTETVSINQPVADTLPVNVYHDVVTLLNATNGNGNTSRNADLTVNDPNLQAVIYTTPNPMTIAPYTTLFSGMDSVAGAAPIVKWNWDFGDSGSGNPQTDEEMMALHRYDNPGTYTIKLTVTDSNGNTNSTSMSLTVAAFNGKTFYVSSSAGSDSNDGSSSRPFKTLDYAFSKMASNRQNQPDKLLLACGDKWSFGGDLGPPKPSILDCYGSGAQPVIEFTTLNGIGWYGGSGGTPDTWGYSPIVQNLHIRYAGGKNGSDTLVNPFIRGSTFRNCTVENGGIIGSLQREGLVIEGCNVSWGMKLGVYSSGSNVVLRRSTFTGSGTDNTFHHQIYLNNGSRWMIEDCVFDGANTGLNNNAAKFNGGNGVVIRRCEARGSRNGFDAGRNLEETGSGPADNYLYDECISHDNGFGGQAAGLIVSWIRHLTVRNCVFYNHDPSGGGCGAIWLWSSNDTNNNVNLYHNVFYSNTIPDIYFSSAQYNLVMRNNIFLRDTSGNTGSYMKLNDPGKMLPLIDADHDVYFWNGKSSSNPGFGFSATDANTSFDTWKNSDGKDSGGIFGDPQFTDPVNLDFTLKEGSPAIDEGVLVPTVLKDKAGVARPQGKAPDAGVFEK